MKKALSIGGLFVLVALSAGCSFKIFEDVGTDPHPPTVELIALVHYVAPVTKPVTPPVTKTLAATEPGRIVTWESGGFTLAAGQKFQIERAYTDAGGDIVRFVLHDRDGPLSAQLTPTDQTYYSGTSGTVLGPEGGIELSGVIGRHRLQFWAEDSHDSRSEKVEFVVNFTGL